MATITSTIRLVDQMTPTLNRISQAIDRVNAQSRSIGRNSASSFSTFNTGVTRATKGTHNLYNALRRAVFMLGTLKSLQGFSTVADTMMNAAARIDNINDDLYTTSQYMDMIYQSAQRSRGDFATMATTVGKLGTVAGDAFGSVKEMVGFTELMNKLFVISGASAAEASNAMYQLTQAMAAGKLQGDEMRSILENAPMLAEKIAQKLGVTKGEIKALGAKGVITADIIKDALFGAADDIEERFARMPKTIGQTWTEIKNFAINAFRPVIEKIQSIINSKAFENLKNKLFSLINSIADGVIRLMSAFNTPRVQGAIQQICDSLSHLWGVVKTVGDMMVQVAIWICDNWSWIAPIVYAVVAAIVIFNTAMMIASAVETIAAIATFLLTTALGQVLLIIIAVVAVIYLLVAAWNYFTGSTVSATGVILWAVGLVVGTLWDLVVFLWDCLCVIVDGLVLLAKWLGQAFIDTIDFLAILFTDFLVFVFQLVVAIIIALGDILLFLWDCLGSIVDGIVYLGKLIWQILSDVAETIVIAIANCLIFIVDLLAVVIEVVKQVAINIWETFVWIVQTIIVVVQNICKFVANLVIAIGKAIAEICVNIWNTFVWLLEVIKVWCSNVMTGMSQLCSNLPIYWELFKLSVVQKFWSMVYMAGNAFNALLQGAHDLCEKMIQPFVDFAQAVVDVLNMIIDGWNAMCSTLTMTVDTNIVTQAMGIAGKEIGLSGAKLDRIGDVTNPLSGTSWSGINLSGVVKNLSNVGQSINNATAGLTEINWSSTDLPSYSDYVNWGSVKDAFNEGMNTFDYGDIPEYDVDWGDTLSGVKDAFNTLDFIDMSGIWDGADYAQDWGEFVADLKQTWDTSQYDNPLDAFEWGVYENPLDAFELGDYANALDKFVSEWNKTWNGDDYVDPLKMASDWYNAGAAFDGAIAGFMDGLGGILKYMDITGDPGFKDWDKEAYESSGNNIATSLEDLLDGYSGGTPSLGSAGGKGGSGGGGGSGKKPANALDKIANATGNTADSTGNIEDTLDLAEEELELLRKLAEQEIINRFTTAEIHVDMTNNNNISSGMDLDGIVTHLSNKLYEELGVVASGVHY